MKHSVKIKTAGRQIFEDVISACNLLILIPVLTLSALSLAVLTTMYVYCTNLSSSGIESLLQQKNIDPIKITDSF